VPDTVARSNASHLLTWLQDEIVVETPRLILPEEAHPLSHSDISNRFLATSSPEGRHRPADRVALQGGNGALVVHAGRLSAPPPPPTPRCAPSIGRTEEYRDAPARGVATAYPNRLMIRLADAALGRQGRWCAPWNPSAAAFPPAKRSRFHRRRPLGLS
jgi:predicted protein tyrosine phosphatase